LRKREKKEYFQLIQFYFSKVSCHKNESTFWKP
jgi:hypothetical protein